MRTLLPATVSGVNFKTQRPTYKIPLWKGLPKLKEAWSTGVLTSSLSWYAGATGLVGSRLVSKLSSLGHTVHVLTRNSGKAQNKLSFGKVKSFEPQQWAEAISGSDAVINLAGQVPFRVTADLLVSCLGNLQKIPRIHFFAKTLSRNKYSLPSCSLLNQMCFLPVD